VTHALVISDANGERRIPLVGSVVVGRDPACEIYDSDPLLSRRHAEFLLTARGTTVKDLNSRNGIQVNGVSVPEALLRPGDVVQIAHLRIKYDQTLDAPTASGGGDAGHDATMAIDPVFDPLPIEQPNPQATQALGPPFAQAAPPAPVQYAPAPAQAPAPPPPRPVAAPAAAAAPAPAAAARQARRAKGLWLIRVVVHSGIIAVFAFLLAAIPALWWHDSQLAGFAEERALTLSNWAAAEARIRLETHQPVGDALDVILKQPGVVGAFLVTPQGKVLAPSTRAQEQLDTLGGLAMRPDAVYSDQLGHDGDLTVAARPVPAGDSPRAAVVWLSLRAADIGTRIEGSGAILVPMFVIALLIGVVTGFLLHRKATKQLAMLNEDAEMAMAGQIPEVLDTLGTAPTRDLATTLNYLLARVRAGGAEVERPVSTTGRRQAPAPAAAAPAAQRPVARQPAPAPQPQQTAPPRAFAPVAPAPPPAPPKPRLAPAQLIANPQLRVTEASESAGALFGVPRDKAVGQHVLDAISDRGLLDAVLKCLSALPPAGQQEATVTHEATGLSLKVKLSRTGKDQPVTIEAQEA